MDAFLPEEAKDKKKGQVQKRDDKERQKQTNTVWKRKHRMGTLRIYITAYPVGASSLGSSTYARSPIEQHVKR